MTTNVRARLNVLGVGLRNQQIDAILDQQEDSVSFERKWLANFFQLATSELTRSLLTRYSEADARMSRISAGTFQEDIHTRLINTLASAKKCYAYGEFLACIELCALHGEMLANYLCITSRDVLFVETIITQLLNNQQQEIRNVQGEMFFSDGLGQRLRLLWLRHGNIITPEDSELLLEIHVLRIQYFHRWTPHRIPINENALNALSSVSQVASRHLELMDNQENLNRVRNYMNIVNAG